MHAVIGGFTIGFTSCWSFLVISGSCGTESCVHAGRLKPEGVSLNLFKLKIKLLFFGKMFYVENYRTHCFSAWAMNREGEVCRGKLGLSVFLMQPPVKSFHINCTVKLQKKLIAIVAIEDAGMAGFWRKSKIVMRFVNCSLKENTVFLLVLFRNPRKQHQKFRKGLPNTCWSYHRKIYVRVCIQWGG